MLVDPPPGLPPDYKLLATAQLPCSVYDFYHHVINGQSQWMDTQHMQMGGQYNYARGAWTETSAFLSSPTSQQVSMRIDTLVITAAGRIIRTAPCIASCPHTPGCPMTPTAHSGLSHSLSHHLLLGRITSRLVIHLTCIPRRCQYHMLARAWYAMFLVCHAAALCGVLCATSSMQHL